MRTAVLGLVSIALVFGSADDERRKQYDADVPKTVVELQPFRESTSRSVKSRSGREGTATLINLNPAINVWFLLRIAWKGGQPERTLHLENPKPSAIHLLFDAQNPYGVVLQSGNERYDCDLFDPALAERAKLATLAWYPLCDGRLFLRNPVEGHHTTLESAVEMLRDKVPGGEGVIDLFHHLMADRYRETGQLTSQPEKHSAAMTGGQPMPADIDPKLASRLVIPNDMGITLRDTGPEKSGMMPGAWYAAANPGTWVSIAEPAFLPAAILESYPKIVNRLDKVEASSLCYLIAFDLDQFEVGYEIGTDHPRVDWSDRVTGAMRDTRLPGPDGIGSIAPLVATGLIRPDRATKTVAAFIGGFKRTHGAFRLGELAARNHGSHYGFVEEGAVLSKLQPGLATVFAQNDGSLDMKTWMEADNALLPRIRYARQNGVPVIETGRSGPVPGALVGRWSLGNWSGSEDAKLRTMRSGLALQTGSGRRFLIYAVFSDATPSAMARVFQAYHVNYAMLLDMNALEHTYAAVYRRSGGELAVDHLLTGMSVLDRLPSGQVVPRFLGYSDNRDFFYVMRREPR